VAIVAVSPDTELPGITADLAVLNQTPLHVRFQVDLYSLAAGGAGDKKAVFHRLNYNVSFHNFELRNSPEALSFLEPRRFLRATCGVAGAVGMSTCPGQFPFVDNQVFSADGAVFEPALQYFAYPGGVARLRR
jgi:hypothetical protein